MDDPRTAIFQAHSQCVGSFSEIISILRAQADNPLQKSSLNEILDEFDKYNIWAGNVGAVHSGKRYEQSLDYRLREASFYRSQILKLFQSLDRTLRRALLLIHKERKPIQNNLAEVKNKEVQLDHSDTSDLDESPWEISSSEDELDGDQDDVPRERMQNITQVDRNLLLVQKPDLPQLFASIKFTITCLYKTPIRQPAPVDRIKNIPAVESHYQHFDILYVKDKFPKLDPTIATRLGKLISRRRQLLLYRTNHDRNLKLRNMGPIPEIQAPVITPAVPKLVTQTTDNIKPGGQESKSVLTRTQITKATTLRLATPQPQQQALYAPSVSEAPSSVASSYAAKNLPVEVPPRPKGKDGKTLDNFECPYCSVIQLIRNDRSWKKHVLSDLQPYVCTFPECDKYELLFENREQWYRHEAQQHKIEWACNTAGHLPFKEQSEFIKHMEGSHATLCTDGNQQSLLARMFQQPAQFPNVGICNLCLKHSNRLKSHVARHLEQISLFSLPRTYGADDDDIGSKSRDMDSNFAKNKSTGKSIDKEDDPNDDTSLDGPSNHDSAPPINASAHTASPSISDINEHTLDESIVLDVSWDNLYTSLRRHEMTGFRPLHTMHGHSYKVSSVAISPDSAKIVSGSYDSTAKVWDSLTGECIYTMKHEDLVTAVGISPDSANIVCGMVSGSFEICDLQSGKSLRTVKDHNGFIQSIAYSPDNQLIASAAWDKTVKLWKANFQQGEELAATILVHSDDVNSVTFSSDGKIVASSSYDHTIKLWDIFTHKLLATFIDRSPVLSVTLSPNGKLLASGSRKTILLWDLSIEPLSTEKSLFRTLNAHSNYINSVQFSPDGTMLASGSDDKTIKIWDTNTWDVLMALDLDHQVTSVAFWPDSKKLAAGTNGNEVLAWYW